MKFASPPPGQSFVRGGAYERRPKHHNAVVHVDVPAQPSKIAFSRARHRADVLEPSGTAEHAERAEKVTSFRVQRVDVDGREPLEGRRKLIGVESGEHRLGPSPGDEWAAVGAPRDHPGHVGDEVPARGAQRNVDEMLVTERRERDRRRRPRCSRRGRGHERDAQREEAQRDAAEHVDRCLVCLLEVVDEDGDGIRQ